VADIIKCLEQEKDNLCITHYSVSQTTLDNVSYLVVTITKLLYPCQKNFEC